MELLSPMCDFNFDTYSPTAIQRGYIIYGSTNKVGPKSLYSGSMIGHQTFCPLQYDRQSYISR